MRLLLSVGLGKGICQVDTTEDKLVFAQITHEQFASEITGRTIRGVHRYGKIFYLELEGQGRTPVLHFGMTGDLQVKGVQPMQYQRKPRKRPTTWPPQYMKFVLHLKSEACDAITEVAFLDPRRLGRIRLCASPTQEPPISELGFDPIHSMPTISDFLPMIRRRTCPIKALLLDQSFSAGVGNWVADEVLYNARIHPEQRSNTLTNDQINSLHHHILDVCRTAISVNADSNRFPENWLFRHRWDKGKKSITAEPLLLPNGEPATIKWVTVGGRTSAYVAELQLLLTNSVKVADAFSHSSEEQTSMASNAVNHPRGGRRKRKRSGDVGL